MILLDPRAGSLPLQRHIPSKFKVVTCYLDSGDASFVGNGPAGKVEAAIEIKHLADMLQSLEDGRLPVGQVLRMREQYDYVFVLLHDRVRCDQYGYLQVWTPTAPKRRPADWGIRKYDGAWYEKGRWQNAMYGARRQMMFADFVKWEISLSVCGGVRMLNAGCNEEAGAVIGAAYEWFKKQWEDHSTFKVFDTSHAPTLLKPSVAAAVAHELVPGVGWEKAMAAAEVLKTPRGVTNASAAEWMKVPGIGKVLAERAVRNASVPHVRREVRGK